MKLLNVWKKNRACKNGQCVHEKYFCDNEIHCIDRSDENCKVPSAHINKYKISTKDIKENINRIKINIFILIRLRKRTNRVSIAMSS